MSKYKIEMEGMSCMHCVGHVENAFKGNEKITTFNVEINKATLEGDISEEEIREIIDDEGYDIVTIEKL